MTRLERWIGGERRAVELDGARRIEIEDLVADLMKRFAVARIELQRMSEVPERFGQRRGGQAHCKVRLREIGIELVGACGRCLHPLSRRRVEGRSCRNRG